MTRITPTPNGPYKVEDIGQILRYADGEQIPLKDGAMLCRCGGSSNKPFCDGTHAKNGFTGNKDPGRVPDQLDHYEGDGVTIHDNRGLCAHAGYCTDGLPEVFKLGTEPWIDPKGADAEAIASACKKCPSGALSHSLNGKLVRDHGGAESLGMAPNGPYVVKGGVDISDVELNDGGTTDHMALCRCGQSANKPFCSGAHWNHHFDEQVKRD